MDYLVAPGPLRPWKNHSDILQATLNLSESFIAPGAYNVTVYLGKWVTSALQFSAVFAGIEEFIEYLDLL